MVQAMMSGVASIEAQQTRMNVIGNDLANINTTAFKGQDVTFEDLISQQVSGATAPNGKVGGTDGISYGLGVQVGSTVTNMTQGSLNATGDPSNLAIQGNGFFMTSNGSQISYTRDGSFTIDSLGNLVSAATGQKVMGWAANSLGVINTSSQVTPADGLQIPIGTLNAAQATANVDVTGNLNSAAAATDTATVTTTIYDAQGNAQDITVEFSNPTATLSAGAPTGATSQWSWTAYPGDTATGTALGSSAGTGNSPLFFNAAGQMISPGPQTFTPAQVGSATPSPVTLNMSTVEQLGATTQVTVSSQDGYPPGSLQNYSVGLDGVIMGNFSNGLSRPLGQVALANFPNPAGLTSDGSNNYTPSANSGVASVGQADSGNLGTVNSGFLEQSNVDLSTSLTNLIVTQRGFEANTKIITTVDQLMQELIEMKH